MDATTRELSRALFGNSYRLEVLAAIAERQGPFRAREIAEQVGVADNLVSVQLARMVDAGLLDRERRGRLAYYRARPSPIWSAARSMLAPPSSAPSSIAPADAKEAPALSSDALGAAIEWGVDLLAHAGELHRGSSDTRLSSRRLAAELTEVVVAISASVFGSPQERDRFRTLESISRETEIHRTHIQIIVEQQLDLLTMAVIEWMVRNETGLTPSRALHLRTYWERSRKRPRATFFGADDAGTLITIGLAAESHEAYLPLTQTPLVIGTPWDTSQHAAPHDSSALAHGAPSLAGFRDHVAFLLDRVERFRLVLAGTHGSSKAFPSHLRLLAGPWPVRTAHGLEPVSTAQQLAELAALADRGQSAMFLLPEGSPADQGDVLAMETSEREPVRGQSLMTSLLLTSDALPGPPSVTQPLVEYRRAANRLVAAGRSWPVLLRVDEFGDVGAFAGNFDFNVQLAAAIRDAEALVRPNVHRDMRDIFGALPVQARRYTARQGMRHLLALAHVADVAVRTPEVAGP